MDWNNIADVRLIELPLYSRSDGDLIVAEAPYVPFAIARVFTVRAKVGAERAKHAHRLCAQFMLCPRGAFDIVCDDGTSRHIFPLDRGNLALLVPPTIWNTVVCRQTGSVLTVLCDRRYEADDYFHEYSEFLAERKAARS